MFNNRRRSRWRRGNGNILATSSPAGSTSDQISQTTGIKSRRKTPVKWGNVEGSPGSYNWTELDNIYNYAVGHSFRYRHHTLIWGAQQPSFMSGLDSAQQYARIEAWMHESGLRYLSTWSAIMVDNETDCTSHSIQERSWREWRNGLGLADTRISTCAPTLAFHQAASERLWHHQRW